jgi:tRNA dimethylallyltransferase
MLYFKALTDGIDPMPGASPQVRAQIEREAQQQGWPALHAELAHIDPITAARLAPTDSQRIQRALEVFRTSGLPLSHFHRHAHTGSDAAQPAVLIALEPHNRAWLHDRIAHRFDQMLTQGLVQEVQNLRARGDLHPDLPSMRCVGYRQVWAALEGNARMAEVRDKGIFATRQLAKRQMTWLRSMAHRQVVACDAPDSLQQVLQSVRIALEQRP